MSSQQKKVEKALAKRDADGYPGLIPLREIYHFEDFLTHERDWHSAITQENELLHVYRYTGEEIIVWFKERPRLIVLSHTTMPAVLVETAFIDEEHDEELLRTRQDDFARAIARGITDYENAQ